MKNYIQFDNAVDLKNPDPLETWYKSVQPNPRDQNENALFRRVKNNLKNPLEEDEEYKNHLQDIDVLANAPKKRGPPIDQDDRGQKITAAGGSAINTAVFVQNCAQVHHNLYAQIIIVILFSDQKIAIT